MREANQDVEQEGEGTSSCPDSWYSPIAIEKWLDRGGVCHVGAEVE